MRHWLLFVLALSGFVTSFGAHIVTTNLPSYAQAVGAGAFTIGMLIAVYDFAELFAKPMAGFVADRRGMKPMLLLGLAVFIGGSALFLIISPTYLLLVRFVQGLGAAALSTVSISLVARYFEQGRGRAFGIYNAIKGAGYVIAPASGGFLAQRYGFRSIFLVSAAVGVAVFLLSLSLPRDRAGSLDNDDASLREALSIFVDPILRPIYTAIVLNMFLVGILFGFLPVYLHSIDYSAIQSGAVLSVATAAYLLVQPVAGIVGDKWSTRGTVIIGLLVAAASITVVTFTSGVLLILIVVAAGIGIGTVWTNSDAMVSASVSPERLGMGIGAAQSFKEFGDMVGPLLVGALTHWAGIRAGFVTCGVTAVAAVGVLATRHAGTGVRK